MFSGLWLVLSCVMAIGSGCSSVGALSKLPGMAKKIPEAKPNDPVVEIVGLWQPAKGKGLDDLPTRGFAGQIMFFTRGQKSPVKIDGDVRVYVFDDTGTREEQAKPVHQFDFVDGAWNGYLYDVNVGPSYYVFIPYTRDGSMQTNCTLRVRLEQKSGGTVYSEVANVVLSGSPREEKAPEPNRLAEAMQSVKQTASRTNPLSESMGRMNGSRGMEPTERMRHLLADSNVQPASASVLSHELESPAERLRRLKAVMEQTFDSQPAAIEEPRRIAAIDGRTTPRRFRLTPATKLREDVSSSFGTKQDVGSRHPLAAESNFDSAGVIDPETSQRGRHPLDDLRDVDLDGMQSHFTEGDSPTDPFQGTESLSVATDGWMSDASLPESLPSR